MHIDSLTTYPLSGARGIAMTHAELGPAGLQNDRLYVAYDPETYERVSCKPSEAPALRRIEPEIVGDQLRLYLGDEYGRYDGETIITPLKLGDAVTVYEFEEATPCNDLGDETADKISKYLGQNLRLARKTDEWMAGGIILPSKRANAPLHITHEGSQDRVKQVSSAPGNMAQHFRSSIVVGGVEFDNFSELKWKLLRAGKAIISINSVTLRCPVPDQHPRTGKPMKQVAKANLVLPQAPSKSGKLKRVFGVYGSLVGTDPVVLGVGDEVEVLDTRTS